METENDVVEMPVLSHSGDVKAVVSLDRKDFEAVGELPWRVHSTGYIYRWVRDGNPNRQDGRRRLWLHRELMELPPGDPREVDHVNRRVTDCRRCNLRIVDRQGNAENRGGWGVSAYRGVRFIKGNWVAYVGSRCLGNFDTELDAAKAAARERVKVYPHTVEDVALLEGPSPVRRKQGWKFEMRAPEIERLWREGRSIAEIAGILGLVPAQMGGVMQRMRQRGYDLPYRQRPRRAV